MKPTRKFVGSQCTLALLIPFFDTPAVAQAVDADQPTLEEVLVTARRRTEDLQEIPESVSVLTAETLETARIDNLRELSGLVPNFSMFFGEQSFRAGVIQLVVRGITTPQNGEAPMSFVVDGVTIPEIDFINQDLFDIESIQVLRGPQGALYGRGALGGAVLINTKQPGAEVSGYIAGALEEGNDTQLKFGVSGPLVADDLFFSLSGSVGERDGLINNTVHDKPVDFKDSTIVRGGLKYLATDDVTIDWKFNFLESVAGGGIFSIVPIADLNRNFQDSIDQNILGANTRDIFQTSMKIDWDLGGSTLTSISAYAEIDDEIVSDLDFGPAVSDAQRNATIIDSYTQELRLTSADDQRFRWILGAFYQNRSKEYEFDVAEDVGRTAGNYAQRFDVTFEQRDNTDSEAVGLFAQVNHDITDQLELTGAIRYDRDSREFEDPRIPDTNASTSFDEVQPKVSLAYDWSEDLLFYLTYSHGFRSGGFNEIGFGEGEFGGAPTVYLPETSDSLEGGFKARMMDGRMTLNAALFETQLENNQFTMFDAESYTLGILGINEAEVTGLDLEIVARPADGLDLAFGVGLSDSDMIDYDGTGLNDGNNIPFVPDHTINASAQYTWLVYGNQTVVSRIDYSGMSKVSLNQSNAAKRKATDILNLSVSWSNSRWTVQGYLKNVTDERAPVDFFDYDAGLVARSPNAPKAFGLDIRFDY